MPQSSLLTYVGSGVIREKDSTDLFTVDVRGDSTLSKKFSKHVKKSLKADEIIAQRSPIPAVSLRKRSSEAPDYRDLPQKRLRQNWVSYKELAQLKKVADGRHGTTIKPKDASYDVWDMQPIKASQKTLEILPELVSAKPPKSMRQKPVSLAAGGKEIPAVFKPAGGYSYNPLATDYEARLSEESVKAMEIEKQRLAAEEAEKLKREAAIRSAAEAEIAEDRADLSEWEEDSEWEGFQSGAEDQPMVKQPQRKTRAQRNRIERRKEEERLAKHKAAMKARRIQEDKIKQLAEEIGEEEKARALKKSKAMSNDDQVNDEKLRRKQLGKFKLPDRDLELVLPDELEESLRRLKPEGNLLKDRYRSMLVRGKMESRRHLPFRKQARRKITEKWTHKDFVL